MTCAQRAELKRSKDSQLFGRESHNLVRCQLLDLSASKSP